jgi:aldehyde:ferredoxin oxidoreductase
MVGVDIMNGYKDCVLTVNLSEKTASRKKLNRDYIDKFLGGEGYGAALTWYRTPFNIHAFSPGNILSFNAGPLTGTPAPSASMVSVVFISPLTNTIGVSNLGSHFGAELKFAGYDSIVIEGISDTPVYLYIDDDRVEIRDASSLWGKNTRETTALVKKLTGEDFKVACIGQAGERLSRLACIFSDEYLAARGGAGAVMGYKKIKAVAVRGHGSVETANPGGFFEYNRRALNELRSDPYTWGPVHGYGTPAWLLRANEYGFMPTNNFQSNHFERMDSLLPPKLWDSSEKFRVSRRACYSCQIGCRKFIYMGAREVGDLEYETISALGPRCGVDSLDDIALASYYTAIYGIDSISAGATVSAAMEWYEKGIIGRDDTDGLELKFGNGKAMVELIRRMGLREGIGEVFADGSYYAALKIGRGTMEYTMHVKKMEIPASDPRGSAAMAIAFGTSEMGACHMRPYAAGIDAFGCVLPDLGIESAMDPFSESEPKDWVKSLKEYFISANLLGICGYNLINAEVSPSTLAGLYSSATGIRMNKYDLLIKAERTIALERAINYKRGFTRKDDYLPKRFTMEEVPFGLPRGRRIDMDTALDRFYDACGYDREKAIPTPEKYAGLGMEDISQEL